MRALRLLLAIPMLAVFASSAGAFPQFYAQFKKDYVDNLKDKKFAEELGKGDVKCLVCHQGKQKKNRNDFGKVVGKLLTKKDTKDAAKIAAGLKKALDTHVDLKNAKSETYLERLNKGEWPGGKLDDLKKDPKKGAAKEGDEKKE
jgi:hypothetical protein